ncbi:BBE domain-containing protein, partial [Streptomyces sp. WAC06614]|uniref:BBE domain-containing protein n=1 Tax=Streptomyces sp. WAC06614 TaxID=2487416 RepID=UPI0021B0075E
ALNRVPAGATAFVHRTSAFLAQYLAYWPASAPADQVGRQQAWLDGLWQRLRPWAGGSAYQNYADPRLADWRTAYYGANLARPEPGAGRRHGVRPPHERLPGAVPGLLARVGAGGPGRSATGLA